MNDLKDSKDLERPADAKFVNQVSYMAYVAGGLLLLPVILVSSIFLLAVVKDGITDDIWPPPKTEFILFCIVLVVGSWLVSVGRKLQLRDSSSPIFPSWLYFLIGLGLLWALISAAQLGILGLQASLAFFFMIGLCIAGIRYNRRKYPKK
jgi:hypothetical protein